MDRLKEIIQSVFMMGVITLLILIGFELREINKSINGTGYADYVIQIEQLRRLNEIHEINKRY